MGVKYGREYHDIIHELTAALLELDGVYSFFEMDQGEWQQLGDDDKEACLHTLADDVFYALGEESRFPVGNGVVEYDAERHILKVYQGPKVFIINLI